MWSRCTNPLVDRWMKFALTLRCLWNGVWLTWIHTAASFSHTTGCESDLSGSSERKVVWCAFDGFPVLRLDIRYAGKQQEQGAAD